MYTRWLALYLPTFEPDKRLTVADSIKLTALESAAVLTIMSTADAGSIAGADAGGWVVAITASDAGTIIEESYGTAEPRFTYESVDICAIYAAESAQIVKTQVLDQWTAAPAGGTGWSTTNERQNI